MMYDYILVTVRYQKLSVLRIRIFDPECVSVEDPSSKDPHTFSGEASAYTEHGMPLEKGMYPWGNDGDLFPYSEEVFQVFRIYERTNDISGYRMFFKERAKYMGGINYPED